MRRGKLSRILSLLGIGHFTDRIRAALAYADREARRLNQESIGTEHLLLGFIREGTGVGVKAVQNLGVDLTVLQRELNKVLKTGPDAVTKRRLSQTRRAKQVITYAIKESRDLDQTHVGTEHLLLGLLRVDEGIAAHVLTSLGMKLETTRTEVVRLLEGAEK